MHNPASAINLKKGRKNGFRFQPWGVRREIRLSDIGIETPSYGHRVIRASDIGQQWMRQQAALDYSFERWQKLLSPTELAAPLVEEQ